MKPNKKGFTIVEIVISLVVIAIVSVVATSVALSGQRIQRDARDKFFAANYCNNFTAIFQAAMSEKYGNDATIADMYGSFCGSTEKLLEIALPALNEATKEPAGDPEGNAEPTETVKTYSATIYFNSSWTIVEEGNGEKFRCIFIFTESSGNVTFDVKIVGGKELYSSTFTMPLGGAL